MFYVPNLPYALFLALKARDMTFFTAVNPVIKDSGNGTESKYKTIELWSGKYFPRSVFVTARAADREKETIRKILKKNNLKFPLIAKPDIGFRGMLVKKLDHEEELFAYLERFPVDIILQDFVDYPNECGILYRKMPGEDKGSISSVTLKSFLSVKGNGISTLEELVMYDKRAIRYLSKWREHHAAEWNRIPEKDEIVTLSYIGNHVQGAQFINGNHLIDEELTSLFDRITQGVEGWHYGRFDIKYKDWESFKQGKDFYILEVNGIISEPTHIYDPIHITFLKALSVFRLHWKYLYQIAVVNKKNGVKTTPLRDFVQGLIRLRKYTGRIKKLNDTHL